MKIPFTCALTLILASVSSGSLAADQLESQLGQVVRAVQSMMKSRGYESVSVGKFSGPPSFPTGSGISFSKMLKDEFTRAGVAMKRRAPIGLKGEYAFVNAKPSDDPLDYAIELLVSVVDNNGQVLTDFDVEGNFQGNADGNSFAKFENGKSKQLITDVETIAIISGPSTDIAPDKSRPDRKKQLKKSVAEPETHFDGTKILPSAESPYAIELLLKEGPGYVARKVRDEEGLAFCEMKMNEVYGVRVYNNSEFDAAVILTIDGVNMFAFADKPHRHVVIPKGKSTLIKGWYRSPGKMDSFQIGKIGESAAAELGMESDDVGAITVVFAAAWDVGSDPPEDEKQAQLSRGSGDRLGTKRGPTIGEKTKVVPRHFGLPRAVVSLRYDN